MDCCEGLLYMGFDHCGLSKSKLNHIGVNGSLNQIVTAPIFLASSSNTGSVAANDLALCLGSLTPFNLS